MVQANDCVFNQCCFLLVLLKEPTRLKVFLLVVGGKVMGIPKATAIELDPQVVHLVAKRTATGMKSGISKLYLFVAQEVKRRYSFIVAFVI